MKVLIVDTQFPKGHKNLNVHLICILSDIREVSELKIFNYEEYYNKNDMPEKVCFIELRKLFFGRNVYVQYLQSFVNAVLIRLRMLCVKYDKAVFFTFDTISFPLIRVFCKRPIYLFHHNNTDHLKNRIKLFLFKLYANNTHHIVFADFIKDYLISVGVRSELVHVVPHPLPLEVKNVKMTELRLSIYKNALNERLFLALGHANDEKLIFSIIEYERENHLLEMNGIKLIIRSRIDFRMKSVKSIQILSWDDFMPHDQYESLYNVAEGILILYPESFAYRYSGALQDAFNSRKIVIGRNIPIVRWFAEKYPHSCFVFADIKDLMAQLCKARIFDEQDYRQFISIHSDYPIQKKLHELLLSK